jgi:hypothetical protein
MMFQNVGPSAPPSTVTVDIGRPVLSSSYTHVLPSLNHSCHLYTNVFQAVGNVFEFSIFLRILLGKSFSATQNLTTVCNSILSADVIRRLVDIKVNAAVKQPFNTSSIILQEMTSRRHSNVSRVSAKFALIFFLQ